MTGFSLLSLPENVIEAVADALRRQSGGEGGALHALRATCRQLRAVANAGTRHVSPAGESSLAAATARQPAASAHGLDAAAALWLPSLMLPAALTAGACASLPQLRIALVDASKLPLAQIAQRWPSATKIEFAFDWDSGVSPSDCNARLAACLEALPDACFPAAEVFENACDMTATLAAHAARLCPRLRYESRATTARRAARLWPRWRGSRRARGRCGLCTWTFTYATNASTPAPRRAPPPPSRV